ncbi:Ketosteroid isomerase homolog [Granulicella pectinivorans]|uniref:Ketosteroid isomerase homolog n=1 Tax=Granulicella pectinivorans TaxID=474950 RepID=A0A1I6L2I3_9BACT|nr:DUF4440 domain-containing protein [Granulicella pectinivorans]SFR97723.1 Ketosteroid isomerase homolog [Granulicella pectinivorans]
MKIRRCVTLLALSVSTFVCAQTFTGSAKSLADADAGWEAAIHAGKLDKAMEFVAPDAFVYEPNMPVLAGTDKITASFRELISIPGIDFSWKALHAEVSGDMGFTDGEYAMSFKGPDGKPILDKGKYVTVWHRDKAGKWRVVRDIFNSDLPTAK